MSFAEPDYISSPTGAVLALRHQPAFSAQSASEPSTGQSTPEPSAARAVIQINHGLAEHSARYQEFAEYLAGQGFEVYAHDHRGHGLTTAPDAPAGQFAIKNGAEKVLHDVGYVHRHIHKHHPDLPVIMFGHSMGGLITLAALCGQYCKPLAAAICNANFANVASRNFSTLILKAERMLLGSDVPSPTMPKLTFQAWAQKITGHQTQFDWLSHEPEAVAAYNADPLCGFNPSVGMWLDIFNFMQRSCNRQMQQHIASDIPFYLQGGGQDPATDNGKAVIALNRRLSHNGFNDITQMIYPEMRHESLHETGKQQAMQDFVTWANQLQFCSSAPEVDPV